MKREQATSPEPNNTAPTLLRLRRNTVHGSRTSPRRYCSIVNSTTYPFALRLSKGSE
jgi:hypothetical protein